MAELRYFAWIRERIGTAYEPYEGTAQTVRELLAELAARGEGYAAALADLSVVNVAVDQELGDHSASIAGAREIAIFPPMTGG